MDNHKALEDAVLAIKYADTPVKVGSFQGFDLSVTVNSKMFSSYNPHKLACVKYYLNTMRGKELSWQIKRKWALLH